MDFYIVKHKKGMYAGMKGGKPSFTSSLKKAVGYLWPEDAKRMADRIDGAWVVARFGSRSEPIIFKKPRAGI